MNPRITHYLVVRGHVLDIESGAFAEKIQIFINGGWQPFGNIGFSENYSYVTQAIVKYSHCDEASYQPPKTAP